MNKSDQPFSESFSVVIAAYNREWCIEKAINSAFEFLFARCGSEIIVVDDGSVDATAHKARALFEKLRAKNGGITFSLIQHEVNRGVCAAKNQGARSANGDWLIFLDSDDELIPSAYPDVLRALKKDSHLPLHFFRCVEEKSKVISNALHTIERGFDDYLMHGTDGEALPIVARNVFSHHFYDEDISGYESLSYLRIIRKYKYTKIHSTVARRYYTSHSDRLSAKAVFKRRSSSLAKGHLRVLTEHASEMSAVNISRYVLKYLRMKCGFLTFLF